MDAGRILRRPRVGRWAVLPLTRKLPVPDQGARGGARGQQPQHSVGHQHPRRRPANSGPNASSYNVEMEEDTHGDAETRKGKCFPPAEEIRSQAQARHTGATSHEP